MIPNHYPPHWKNALAKGDATGFRTEGDMVSFFFKARFVTAFGTAEDRNYHDLADRHPKQYEAAIGKARAEDRSKFERSEAEKLAPFTDSDPGKPTAISNAWAKAIERLNSQMPG
ncbi:hypothetical protein EOB59_29950 [Mesorhizobium sp. M7A.F.Ca.MR.176.00.0.0]|uniref:hypothetical protein n=1 Tax=Mesorhizobium sp. M7A.F.Ca.MR.176.00.0.0 TaxID=2496776 RepID=UPI000FD1DC27|nr:hypothetical protein [Mesorhizobium sp. M7A.F.Ca.MR.176.00.0.0]RUU86107.1 hypothetical protein EOB59_29950 [Mesorhizobium sp. M7A.F.Ca.MR.176.00.0.0]